VAVNESKEWWTGDTAADLDTYLAAFTADAYTAERFVHATCASCHGTTFALRADDAEGCAQRVCTGCGLATFMLDSETYAEDAELDDAQCPCGGQVFELAVGFALFDDGEVRWVYVGARCVSDGVLGVYIEWKVDYSPSTALFAQV
jgi:hypothetical protein